MKFPNNRPDQTFGRKPIIRRNKIGKQGLPKKKSQLSTVGKSSTAWNRQVSRTWRGRHPISGQWGSGRQIKHQHTQRAANGTKWRIIGRSIWLMQWHSVLLAVTSFVSNYLQFFESEFYWIEFFQSVQTLNFNSFFLTKIQSTCCRIEQFPKQIRMKLYKTCYLDGWSFPNWFRKPKIQLAAREPEYQKWWKQTGRTAQWHTITAILNCSGRRWLDHWPCTL